MRVVPDLARYSNVFDFQFINGLCFGMEYVETEEMGFILCIDLGLLRILWYKDLVAD